jgi:predicted DsbA family dithiol-disulfide isomerase
MIRVTYYLEVISSWCHWAEPAWSELRERYGRRAQFGWKIALMPPDAYPVSRQQCDWFYRRSGSIMRSPYMLNSGWLEPQIHQYLVPNYVALAARQLGVVDDRVRLALAHAAVREGRQVGRWEVAVPIAAAAGGLDPAKLQAVAQAPETEAAAEASTAEFKALQITQRPAFVIENGIGDRAVFSGTVRAEPLVAALEAQLADEAAYASWQAHFGDPPAV